MMIMSIDDKWLLHITNMSKDCTQTYAIALNKPLSRGDLGMLEQMIDNAIEEIGGVTKGELKEYINE